MVGRNGSFEGGRLRAAVFAAWLLAAHAVFAQRAGAPPGSAFEAKWDELWKKRDTSDAQTQLARMVKAELAQDPASFEATWRRASLLAWQADGAADGSELKAALGKLAWEAADKAVAARPDDVRGHYFGGTGIGLYS